MLTVIGTIDIHVVDVDLDARHGGFREELGVHTNVQAPTRMSPFGSSRTCPPAKLTSALKPKADTQIA
jgi:hypothetical protein